MLRFHATTFALALLATTGVAQAGTPINETRPLDARGRLDVENVKGSIEIRSWDRNEVRIEGTLGAGVEKFNVTGDRNALKVEVKYPQRSGLGIFNRAETEPTVLRIMAPVHANLDVSAVSADVTVWGAAPNAISIENVSGDTRVAAAPDSIEVNSVSGDVDLTVNRADVDVESVSGDIRVSGRLGGDVAVETVSGDVDVRALDAALRRFEGNSVSGDMSVRAGLQSQARMTLESVSGDLDVYLPRTVSAEVRAESFSGSLFAPNARIERPEHGPGSSFRQRYGAGGAEVSIETFSGDARLHLD